MLESCRVTSLGLENMMISGDIKSIYMIGKKNTYHVFISNCVASWCN